MYAVSLILCFSLLGVGLTKAFSNFFLNQNQEVLIQQGEKISKVFTQSTLFGDRYSNLALQRELKFLEQYLDISFIIVDENDYIVLTSSDIDKKWFNVHLELSEHNFKNNKVIYKIQGTMGGIFPEPMLTIGYPLGLNTNQDLGIAFISYPLTQLLKTIEKAFKIITVITIITVFIAFIFIYLSSKKISQPLIEINKAAHIISQGDFEKRININSKDEIGQLAAVLNGMAKSLSEQEKLRKEFISNVSHDIRSPLTSMKGFLQAIIDGTIPEDQKEKYLNIILEETNRLNRISNTILDINRLEATNHKCKFVKFNINGLIRNIIMRFETRLIEKKIKVNLVFDSEELIVLADLEKVERIIYNLMENALKFTEDNKNIFINTKTKGEKAVISIKDEGIGISEEDQKRVFERFFKADISRGQDKKGSGLGLAIVKEFIRAQGEMIYLNSELGKGTEFIFTLNLVD